MSPEKRFLFLLVYLLYVNDLRTCFKLNYLSLEYEAKFLLRKEILNKLVFCASVQENAGYVSEDSEALGVRLNKCFKQFASRRESDRFINEGRVKINGKLAVAGDRAFKGDQITLDGQLIAWDRLSIFDENSAASKLAEKFIYIKYWKPRGVVCTTNLEDKHNILEALGHSFPDRIYPVGRLDKDTTGIILLTSDGRLPNLLGRKELQKDKIYTVTTDRPVTDRELQILAEGVMITTKVQRDRKDKEITAKTLPCQIERVSVEKIKITLQEGRNRQIRKMCEALGFTVTSLHRESFCGINLQNMVPGSWMYLSENEIESIL